MVVFARKTFVNAQMAELKKLSADRRIAARARRSSAGRGGAGRGGAGRGADPKP